MKQVPSNTLDIYQFEKAELDVIKETLDNPLIRAYIQHHLGLICAAYLNETLEPNMQADTIIHMHRLWYFKGAQNLALSLLSPGEQ